MMFPVLTPINIDGHLIGFSASLVECKGGAYDIKGVVKVIASEYSVQPHEIISFDFEPDEDCKEKFICDYWSIITSKSLNPKMKKLYWGKGKSFQSSFIMALKLSGNYHPFNNEADAQQILEMAVDRQKYWGQKDEFKYFDTLSDLIKGVQG